MKHQKGFTLIEIMIVIAMIALLALATMPMGGSWLRSADLQRTEGQLLEAIGRAKAGALRNPSGTIGDDPVMAICLDSTLLQVLQGSGGSPPDCSGTIGAQIWKADLDPGVTITEVGTNGATITCACFNNKGLLTTNSCTSCTSSTTFTLTAGGKHATVSIH